MSWSARIENTPDSASGAVDEAIYAAREAATAADVDEAVREARDAMLDAQLAFVRAAIDAAPERVVTFSISGHLNDDGSGSISISGTLEAPPAVEANELGGES